MYYIPSVFLKSLFCTVKIEVSESIHLYARKGRMVMNSELIKELKHVKVCLVRKELKGEEWEERQQVLQKLEDAVSYLNDCTAKEIEF